MSNKNTNHSTQAATYFDHGFRALFKRYSERTMTSAEFVAAMDELKEIAETNCRKDIIQAFDMGFKLGVFWHIEITETKQEQFRYHGKDYYENIFEGGVK
jgi:hypothetical protein